MYFTNEELRSARRADLYHYLITHHKNLFHIEGNSIHPKNNHSLSIKRGYAGYKDFSTGETGNSLDFLVNHLGYTITDAVAALSDSPRNVSSGNCIAGAKASTASISEKTFNLPEPIEGSYRQLFAYLMKRGIPAEIIQILIDQGILYQEKEHNNIVFINKERDFAEIHGSLSYGKSFHSCRKKSPDRFWWFRTSKDAEIAYVCEASIDAISLYILNQINKNDLPAYYISIGGVANQKTIDRIKQQSCIKKIILAVDNDKAGQECRDKNAELAYLLPKKKDWNEDLLARQ